MERLFKEVVDLQKQLKVNKTDQKKKSVKKGRVILAENLKSVNNASNVTLAESNKNNENLLSSKFVLHGKKDNSVKVAAILYT